VTLVAGNTRTGTANPMITLSTGQYGAQEYLIEVSLGGSYKNTQQTGACGPTLTTDYSSLACNDPAYVAAHPVVTVMIPATRNSMQGTGTLTKLTTAAGVYGSGTVNYTAGFNYTNKLTNTQGKMELIIEQPDGTYYIKSNSITSVAFGPLVNNIVQDVTVYTKASIYKIVNGKVISIDGSVTFRMDAHDGGATGTDMIGFTVLSSKDGTLYYSNNWVYDTTTLSWRTLPQPVNTAGGRAVVIN